MRCWKSELNPSFKRWANCTATKPLLSSGACMAETHSSEFTIGKILTTMTGHHNDSRLPAVRLVARNFGVCASTAATTY